MSENKTGKYLKYAVGEIILVVIGILIALQINNWNNERIEKTELNGLLQNIASGVKSDIRNLNLLVTARDNTSKNCDSILNSFVRENKKALNIQEAGFINISFLNVLNTVSFNPNLSAFEALNNSSFSRNIQGSDLSLLLNAYLTSANQIIKIEEQYHEDAQNNVQEWSAEFRNSGLNIFFNPWNFIDKDSNVPSRFLDILRDDTTASILLGGYYENRFNLLYNDQIMMGNKLIEMVENSQTNFDEQTKLDFSGILYSFADADYLSILMNGRVPTGFDLRYTSSGFIGDYFLNENDYLTIKYPENTFDWGSPYFWVNALNGRVNEMDFSSYSKLIIEMKGNKGGEVFSILMKDTKDPPDGSESKIKIELTDVWKTFEINTSEFKTADMKIVNVPLGFLFEGPTGREIHVRSIQFRKD